MRLERCGLALIIGHQASPSEPGDPLEETRNVLDVIQDLASDDEIDGFRLFLVTAEKDRLEALNPPNVTPAVFEKFLPYAIALDCENQWSKKFEAEAAAAGMARDAGGNYYTPVWYSGGSFNNLGAAGFAGALGASMAAAAASAATAPGSSSGSGGGGFSGGGGGGGGGGGW